jgi:lipopolysaccharide/colanic/teichoic acid biosynthesis glycosyltransferase
MNTSTMTASEALSSPRKSPRAIRWPQRIPEDFTQGLLPERVFLGILSLERKRAERASRQFLLFLLDAEDIENRAERDATLQSLIAAVAEVRRETDLTGWYRQDGILGLIFTELEADNLGAVTDFLMDKVVAAVRKNVDDGSLDLVHLSVHPFPAKAKGGDWNDHRGPGSRALYPDLIQRGHTRKSALIVKRIMDAALSALALVVLSPLFAVIAAAIKLSSEGPVFFTQERLGQYGKTFTCLKFRTMYMRNNPKIHQDYVERLIRKTPDENASSTEGQIVYKIKDDPRVTGVGRFLRKSSLDELPQLLNVLKSEMSLVGPRPPVLYEYEAYDIWHRRRVFEVKPGITGLWQVKGRSQVSFDEMVRLDLRYARSWSFWLDIRILLQTPRAVLSGKGAY